MKGVRDMFSLEERIVYVTEKKNPLRFLTFKNRKIVQSPFWIRDPILRNIKYRCRLYASLSKIKNIRLQAALRLLETERQYNQKKQ
jgi:hypothetical protein